MTRIRGLIVTALLGMCGSAAAGEEGLFPFVVSYDSPANATNVSAWLDRPAGHPRLHPGRRGAADQRCGPGAILGHEHLLRGVLPDPPAGRPPGRPAGPAGHQLRAYAPHGQLLHLGE